MSLSAVDDLEKCLGKKTRKPEYGVRLVQFLERVFIEQYDSNDLLIN